MIFFQLLPLFKSLFLLLLRCLLLLHPQVDKLWSLAPPLHCLLLTSYSSPRALLLVILPLAWGSRLTYNFWRRGGYSWPPWRGEEDYRCFYPCPCCRSYSCSYFYFYFSLYFYSYPRWAIVRTWPVLDTSLGWIVFHLLFICCYQLLLLWYLNLLLLLLHLFLPLPKVPGSTLPPGFLLTRPLEPPGPPSHPLLPPLSAGRGGGRPAADRVPGQDQE